MPDVFNSTLMSDPGDVLDRFELAWRQENAPLLTDYISALVAMGDSNSLVELMQVDLERRWRCQDANIPHFVTRDYLALPGVQFRESQVVELVCWEYHVRNRWGDCPSRFEMSDQWPDSRNLLEPLLVQAASELSWPHVTVRRDDKILVQVMLDGPIEIGRQRPNDPTPFGVTALPNGHRLVVAEWHDASISRQQLRIRLSGISSVDLTNTSKKRALAIEGYPPLDANESLQCTLPVSLHLRASDFLTIAR